MAAFGFHAYYFESKNINKPMHEFPLDYLKSLETMF